jgi:hypothetical protein
MFFIAGVITTVGLIGFVIRVWNKIASGQGADYYKTFWGVEFSYIGVFIIILLLPFILLIGLLFRYLERREEKDFLQKYGKK